MRTTDTPYITDWFAVSIRWLFLVGLVISLSLGGNFLVLPNILLVGLACWNIFLTLLTGLNRRLAFHREIGLGVDMVVATAYFGLTGGYTNPAFWIVFLPLITSALYFELTGALISAIFMTAVQLVVTVSQTLSPIPLVILGVFSLFTFLIAGVFGYISVQLVKTIRRNRQTQQEIQQKKLGMENERLRAVYSLTSTLLATLNYQRVLESVLDLSLSAINTEAEAAADDRLVCAVLLFSKNESLEVGSARRLTTADMRVVLHGQTGAVAQAIEQDKPILLNDVSNDPELTRFIAFQRCAEIYCFPLRSGFSAYGVLLFGHPQPGFFTRERREVLEILGGQAVIAIQNARLYQDVVDERERMIDAQEEARKKLARDLHDGPTQSVAAIAMRVNMAQHILMKDPKTAGEELARIEELAQRTTKEIRHMLFTLRPLVLESQGLVAALQSMAVKIRETYSQNVFISVEENILTNFEVGKQGVVFFIVEEAVNNARKHAQAEHIWVNLRSFEKEMALLEVQDDGVGFDVAAVNRSYDQRGSLGMVNLRERTELVNGVMNIQSSPGKGTRVQVYIPLTEEAADRLHHASGNRNH
ncbi:MAG: histidine kinase [Anaerolineales bacterium]|jgi:signal transduction histidine kinase